jgi:fermentation-respiration switch protein FrsA (DUF1100 family)
VTRWRNDVDRVRPHDVVLVLQRGGALGAIFSTPAGRSIAGASLVATLLYAALGTLLWLAQGHLIFQPERNLGVTPAQLPFPVAEFRIPVSGQETLDAWWIAPRKPQGKLFLYFHGNDGNVASSIAETEILRGLGHGVLMPDYRGFGESDGRFPTEAHTYEDADAALGFAVRELGYSPKDIYVYGHSLGAAVAIDLAARHPELGGLVAESAFTSIADMARLTGRYAIFPIDRFLNQRFQSVDKVSSIGIPALFIHGTNDERVPFEMGEKLYARSGGRKHFLAIPGGRHDDNRLVAPGSMRAALEQLVLDSDAEKTGGSYLRSVATTASTSLAKEATGGFVSRAVRGEGPSQTASHIGDLP